MGGSRAGRGGEGRSARLISADNLRDPAPEQRDAADAFSTSARPGSLVRGLHAVLQGYGDRRSREAERRVVYPLRYRQRLPHLRRAANAVRRLLLYVSDQSLARRALEAVALEYADHPRDAE